MDFPNHSDETSTKNYLSMQNTILTDLMSPTMGKHITVNQIRTLCTRFSTAITDYSRNKTTAVASLKTGIPPHNAVQ
jgi:benzoyl-CoA reductase/2-hydroxyglutaryl-CoA dehydratase subunit BcrC/BadD/HgdB